MKINQLQSYTEPNKTISSKGAREVVRTLANSDSLAATILLESFVTGGRSINAYKRGGFYETRERFTDDVVSAFFWMKGVDIFNKLGDKFGKKVLKLPVVDFDCGKDALRSPIENLVSDLNKTQNPETAKKLYNKLALFKFSKIILSSILAIGFVGFCLPKINQFITKYLMKNKKTNNKNEQNNTTSKPISINEFSDMINKKNNKDIGFKGLSAASITKLAHNLETNKICKMLTCDTGILTGRITTARNKDEGMEYLFRDTASSFFYYASTPLIYKGLQKITGSCNSTTIDPVASRQIHEKIIEQLKSQNIQSIEAKEFLNKTIGVIDDKAKALLEKLPFNSDVISLDELKKYIKDENILSKASEMAKLQPATSAMGQILTKQQVKDVFTDSAITSPQFMQSIFKEKFKGDLTNPYKFIPMKKITSFRDNIDKYIQSIADEAVKNNNGKIDINFLDKLSKKNFIKSVGFRFFALGVSAFALGFAIPKIQYAITKKRTGKNEAPGLREYNNNNETKKSES